MNVQTAIIRNRRKFGQLFNCKSLKDLLFFSKKGFGKQHLPFHNAWLIYRNCIQHVKIVFIIIFPLSQENIKKAYHRNKSDKRDSTTIWSLKPNKPTNNFFAFLSLFGSLLMNVLDYFNNQNRSVRWKILENIILYCKSQAI